MVIFTRKREKKKRKKRRLSLLFMDLLRGSEFTRLRQGQLHRVQLRNHPVTEHRSVMVLLSIILI